MRVIFAGLIVQQNKPCCSITTPCCAVATAARVSVDESPTRLLLILPVTLRKS